MNGQSLDEIVSNAVSRVCARAAGPLGTEDVLQAVLRDPEVALILDGYRMHGRIEGMEAVVQNDVRQRVIRALQDRAG